MTGLRQARALAARLFQSTDDRAPASRREIAIDTGVAIIATIAVVTTVSKTGQGSPGNLINLYPGPQIVAVPSTDGTDLQAMVIGAVTTAPLALRRIYPLATFWLIVAAAAAGPHYAANVITLAAVVLAAYSAMAYSRYRLAAVVSVPVAALLDLVYLHNQQSANLPPKSAVILILFPVLVLASTIRQWRHQVNETRTEMARLQTEHEAETATAIAAERARIASELHDVVTHNVSMMIVQAGAARHVLNEAPDQATAALLAVESSGRAAMAELRHLLGLLSPAPEKSGSEAAGLAPQPGLAHIPVLVDRVRAVGLPVRFSPDEVCGDLPDGVGLAVYRVVQEALTNVVRHAGRPETTVSVRSEDGAVVAEVVNAGRPLSAVKISTGRTGGEGRGLLGMRERAALYGGELSAGPTPDGGWLVRLRLPLDQSPRPGPALPDVVAASQVAAQ